MTTTHELDEEDARNYRMDIEINADALERAVLIAGADLADDLACPECGGKGYYWIPAPGDNMEKEPCDVCGHWTRAPAIGLANALAHALDVIEGRNV